jgi:Ca2+-binding EF-hand superfamily protein
LRNVDIQLSGNGEVDFSEFLIMMSNNMKKSDSDAELRAVFNVFDVNKSGYITSDELGNVLSTLGERMMDEDIEAMLREADLDDDGKVSYAGRSRSDLYRNVIRTKSGIDSFKYFGKIINTLRNEIVSRAVIKSHRSLC